MYKRLTGRSNAVAQHGGKLQDALWGGADGIDQRADSDWRDQVEQACKQDPKPSDFLKLLHQLVFPH